MDIIAQYKETMEQLKKTKEFIEKLNPKDYELRSIYNSLDSKINRSEETMKAFTRKVESHRCGLCDRPYDEDVPKSVCNIKVCPTCRLQGAKYKVGSDLERLHNLPSGTIKRDCLSKDGKPAKLQPFMDCGLIYKSGVHNIVHELVIELYYNNPDLYKRRMPRNKKVDI
ncbi:hypothetical protein NDS46_31040 (plasmid) [Paenibacillus thiaminolyticus]|uniref:hypothetical protein n=1 Tax=Paenibacillus thiaminolyticus TaxID=49283 RepID=UPI00232E2763|nr:hypothetical protein [Paenibacillus thiaminolyticus]WCF11395.1 hypothetical protein NDS46_31040 [Paenibacillus thiaminolyticus]